jgi:hypothetical protein
VEDSNSLSNWLVGHILAKDQNPDHIASEIINRRRALHIEPPAPDRFDRIIRSALSAFEKQFCDAITERLSPQTCERLDALLSPDITGHEGGASPPEQMRAVLTGLLADPGAAKLENLLEMTQRLDRLRSLEIPDDLFQNLAPRIVQSYRQRVAVESPYELRRHAMPLLAAFGSLRKSELTDGLIELLLSTVHRIASKAERRVQKEWINDLKRVTGKNSLLFQVAEHRYRSRKESSRKWSIRW